MIRFWSIAVAVLSGALALGCSDATSQPKDEKPTNPFGVKLEPVPDDDEVKQFAKTVTLAGGAKDANATQWVDSATEGKADSLAGEWSGRWKYAGEDKPWVIQEKPTTFATTGDRVYILFTYAEGPYLIVALRQGEKKDRLVGRFMSVNDPKDTGPWVGLIVDNERIDGEWQGPAGSGRWDFRRKIKK
jgi:hypothetical protein